MAKFIDKKERVYDFKITPYGRHLMSISNFEPVYYAFFDDNVLYDTRYVSGSASSSYENQNDIHYRIKNETQYLEGLVSFTNAEDYMAANGGELFNPLSDDMTFEQRLPRKDSFRYDRAIGDAYLDGETNAAPAWKVVALQSMITAISSSDTINDTLIPQINIEANYHKKIVESTFEYDPGDIRQLNDETSNFIDDKSIMLVPDDPLFYIEEMNTELLTENFDIEVYSFVISGSNLSSPTTGSLKDTLERKYFRKDIPQIENGFLVSETKQIVSTDEITTGSVEYYFDVLSDYEIEQDLACKGAMAFSKKSYYIDLEFDCDQEEEKSVLYDIYGSITEPEICLD
tara:strand:+ start:1931 stop:2962 length:1032 start_codon:yes stop_codon:yes gene_type:complete